MEKMEADLKMYMGQIDDLNKELSVLEEKRKEIIKVGTRLEGVVAYLRQAIEAEHAKADKKEEASAAKE